jgi:hypothetical protein
MNKPLDSTLRAVALAEKARTKRQRRRALVAITEAQADLERRQLHAIDVEFAAMVEGKNYSDARVAHVDAMLAAARQHLTEEGN